MVGRGGIEDHALWCWAYFRCPCENSPKFETAFFFQNCLWEEFIALCIVSSMKIIAGTVSVCASQASVSWYLWCWVKAQFSSQFRVKEFSHREIKNPSIDHILVIFAQLISHSPWFFIVELPPRALGIFKIQPPLTSDAATSDPEIKSKISGWATWEQRLTD